MKLILASQSPRRQELLGYLVKAFEIRGSDIDETIEAKTPAQLVCALAERKACAIDEPNAFVLGADTIVYLDGKILGKPKSREDARKMLCSLSDNTHSVFTGVAIMNTKSGELLVAAESTEVTFAPLSDMEINAYLETEDYADKAGAYGIQGYAARFIERIDGCFYNVMGLPIHKTYQMLKKMDFYN